MYIALHKHAEYLINKLKSAGFEAYAVGGCVRDSIMGVSCGDTDITTNALPEQTKSVFEHNVVLETGIKHGTVTVLVENIPYEITTYRIESGYTDSRHPDKIEFVRNLKEDLARRDFTMNAIAYSHKEGIKDYFGGAEDINNKIIRAVGDPEKRFSEDSLRILRALRFASVLGFEIEHNTSNAIIKLAETVIKVSPERIYTELKKLLCGKNAQSVVNNYVSVISKIINTNGDYKSINKLPADFAMRLSCLCGSSVGEALRFLRADNKTKQLCNLLINSKPIPKDEIALKLYISAIGREASLSVAVYRRALFGEDSEYKTEKLIASNTPLFLSDLAIDGSDLVKLGISGKCVGETLLRLLNLVIKGEIVNERSTLINNAK